MVCRCVYVCVCTNCRKITTTATTTKCNKMKLPIDSLNIERDRMKGRKKGGGTKRRRCVFVCIHRVSSMSSSSQSSLALNQHIDAKSKNDIASMLHYCLDEWLIASLFLSILFCCYFVDCCRCTVHIHTLTLLDTGKRETSHSSSSLYIRTISFLFLLFCYFYRHIIFLRLF